MKDKELLNHIKRSIEVAPIDLLDDIKKQNVVKMIKHDDITTQETTQSSKISLKPIMSLASIAAVFLLMFITVQQFIIPDSEIYLDINPGIQMVTNRKDKVIKLKAVNEEAEAIIDQIEYRQKDIDVVTDKILNSLIDKAYIEKENEVILLSVFNKDNEKSKRQASHLNEVIHHKLDNMNRKPTLLIQAVDKSNIVEEFANKYGISVGKMTFIRNMIILNPNLKTEDLVNLSLTDLIELSRNTGINIEQIIESSDMDRLYEKPEDTVVVPKDNEFDDNNSNGDNDDIDEDDADDDHDDDDDDDDGDDHDDDDDDDDGDDHDDEDDNDDGDDDRNEKDDNNDGDDDHDDENDHDDDDNDDDDDDRDSDDNDDHDDDDDEENDDENDDDDDDD